MSPLDSAWKLVYDFHALSIISRDGIAVRLGLLKKEDAGLADSERYLRVFRRAAESGKLEDLRNAISAEAA